MGYLFETKPICNIQRECLKKNDRERESTCCLGLERLGGRESCEVLRAARAIDSERREDGLGERPKIDFYWRKSEIN